MTYFHLTRCVVLLCSDSDKSAAVEQRQLQQQPNMTDAEQPDQQPSEQRRSGLLRRTFSGWHVYLQQPVLPAAFALALLYLTVMSLGTRSACAMAFPAEAALHCQGMPMEMSTHDHSILLAFHRIADDSLSQVTGYVGGSAVAVPRIGRSHWSGRHLHIPSAAPQTWCAMQLLTFLHAAVALPCAS